MGPGVGVGAGTGTGTGGNIGRLVVGVARVVGRRSEDQGLG